MIALDAAVTTAVLAPAHGPGAHERQLLCGHCGHLLAAIVAGRLCMVISTRAGRPREVVLDPRGLDAVRCERCRNDNLSPWPRLPLCAPGACSPSPQEGLT